jgi:hypothetical protein
MSLHSRQKAKNDGKLNPAELGAISKEIERLEAMKEGLAAREAQVTWPVL